MNSYEYEEQIKQICAKGDFSSLDIFEKNLIAIDSYSRALAKKLLETRGNHTYKVIFDDDLLGLNIDFGNGTRLYNDPKSEIKARLNELGGKYFLYPAIFMYGLGNGALISALLTNENHKTIIVFEPDTQVLFIVLNFIDFSAWLLKNRLVILSSDVCDFSMYCDLCGLDGVFKSCNIFELLINTPAYNVFLEDFAKVGQEFVQMFQWKLECYGADADDTMTGINQTLVNIPDMLAGIPLSKIIKERKNKVKTAIIVSTGPSLTKQLELLKEIKDKATIISVDSSYEILKKQGIKPDFVVSLERIESTAKFFESPVSSFDDDTIFMLSSLMHKKSVEYVKARNYSLVLKPLNFELGFKDNDFGYLSGGHSCAHLGYELAVALEHEKIVLIGQDLAFGNDNITHADGHAYKRVANEKYDKLEQALAYGGKGQVLSTAVWGVFRKEFELLFQKNKTPAYNCTEGGSRIEGAIEKPFKELCEIIKNENKPKFSIPKPLSANEQNSKMLSYTAKLKSAVELGKDFVKKASDIDKTIKIALKSNNVELMKNTSQLARELKIIFENKLFESFFMQLCGTTIKTKEMELTKIIVQNIELNEKLKNALELDMALFKSVSGFVKQINESIEKYFLAKSKV